MHRFFLLLLLLAPFWVSGQQLKSKVRNPRFLTGSQFAASISDIDLSQAKREKMIYREVKKGNIPPFYRSLVGITDTATIQGTLYQIAYFTLPDYLAIGSDTDYFYCPMTPMLAQRVANLFNCSLPTRKMSDRIFASADVKLPPQPIPPSPAMTTVPTFLRHDEMVDSMRNNQSPGKLVAGNKKDVVISNKMYRDGKLRVVIYGWHQPNGKPIQPLYNGHTSEWADYSHGIRLIQNKVWVNGKRTNLKQVLQSPILHGLVSDEGVIRHYRYPKKQKSPNHVLFR